MCVVLGIEMNALLMHVRDLATPELVRLTPAVLQRGMSIRQYRRGAPWVHWEKITAVKPGRHRGKSGYWITRETGSRRHFGVNAKFEVENPLSDKVKDDGNGPSSH